MRAPQNPAKETKLVEYSIIRYFKINNNSRETLINLIWFVQIMRNKHELNQIYYVKMMALYAETLFSM